uniref:(California timema) hypothetical protein n=1 Tax=Timema californicum TaxID=61474 RepID=A0A7R9JAB2_TIMCA|nr:unnamed protein product [Timema californicum]
MRRSGYTRSTSTDTECKREKDRGGHEMKFVRSMLAVTRRNKIRNEVIWKRVGVQRVHEIVEEVFINGSDKCEEYRFFHWAGIDTFVYFSHYLITVPPVVWINAAHLHGVKILGTIITEWNDGKEVWKQVLENSRSVLRFVDCLVNICLHFGFDGYLLNVENPMEQEKFPLFKKPFFELCDGIFLNYCWTEVNLKKSVENAGTRRIDVYVGVDVFGRGCFGGGGFNTTQLANALVVLSSTAEDREIKVRISAVDIARQHGLSVALFAPSWVHEYLGKENFVTHEHVFWQKLWPYLHIHGPTQLPFETSFCQGFGEKMYNRGTIVSERPWYNLSKQQYQPSIASCLGDECILRLKETNSKKESDGTATGLHISSNTTCQAEHTKTIEPSMPGINLDNEPVEEIAGGNLSEIGFPSEASTGNTTGSCKRLVGVSGDWNDKGPRPEDIGGATGCVQHSSCDAFAGGGSLKISRPARIRNLGTGLSEHSLKKIFLTNERSTLEENDSDKYELTPLSQLQLMELEHQIQGLSPELLFFSGSDGWLLRHYLVDIVGTILSVGAELHGSGNGVLLGYLGFHPLIVPSWSHTVWVAEGDPGCKMRPGPAPEYSNVVGWECYGGAGSTPTSGLPSLDSRIRGLVERFLGRVLASCNQIVQGIGDYDALACPYLRIRDNVVDLFVDVGSLKARLHLRRGRKTDASHFVVTSSLFADVD